MAKVAVNTNLAAATGALSAVFFAWFLFGKPDLTLAMNGALAGLVAITAPCAYVLPYESMIIGVIGGIIVVLGTVLVVLVLYTSLLLGVARIPPSIVQRFSDFVPYLGVLDVEGREITDANFAILERVAHWQAAWDMWTDHPWLGVGIGNFEPIYPRYALPLWPLPLGHAHNYYLNIAAEAGAIGLLAYLALWSAAVLGAWQAARRVNGWRWGVALGVLGVLVHLGIHSLVDNLFVHGMYLQLAILMGIVPASSRRSENIDSTHHSH